MLDALKQLLGNAGGYIGNNLSRTNEELKKASYGYRSTATPEEKKLFQDYYMSPIMGATESVSPQVLLKLKPLYRQSVQNVINRGGKTKAGEYVFYLRNKLSKTNPQSLDYKWLYPLYKNAYQDIIRYEDAIQKMLKTAFK